MDLEEIAGGVDWKSIVRTVAPTIATVVSGGNPLVGMGVSALSNALLGKPDGSEAEVQQAILGATPEDLVKLKQADASFKLEMEKCGIEVERIHQEDRDSARDMAIKTKDVTPKILAGIYTLGYFATFGVVLKYGIPTEVKDVVLALIGVMSAAELSIINYYFGSSKGSSEKNGLIASMKK